MRALVHAEGIGLDVLDEVLDVLPGHVLALVLTGELVGDEHVGIRARVHDGLGLGDLVLNLLRDVTGHHDAHVLGGIVDHELRQVVSLLLGQMEHLAGLADREDAGHALLVVPVDDLLHAVPVDLVVGGKGRDHYRPYAILDGLHVKFPPPVSMRKKYAESI